MDEQECSQVFAMLSEYLDDQLTPSSCAELEQHIQDCPPCIEFIESLRCSVQLCRKLSTTAPSPAPSAEQVDALRMAYRDMLDRRSKS